MTPAAGSLLVSIAGEDYSVRDVAAADMAAVLDLHAGVFGGKVDAGWFAWKYSAGKGGAVGVWNSAGRLVAHCAGIPRALLHAGHAVAGLQIGDVMVDPAWRGIMTRRGPFYHACRQIYSSRIGAAPAPYRIGFGFPSERHMRLAVALDLAWQGSSLAALHWSTSPTRGLAKWWRWSPLDPAAKHFDRAVAQAWQAMTASLADAIVGERDPAYVRWRFLDRPDRRYRFFMLHRPWTRTPAGIAILYLDDPQAAQWLDWIGPPGLLQAACEGALAAAAGSGAQTMTAWASPMVAEALQGTLSEPPGFAACVGIPKNSCITQDEIGSRRWWWMGGDTDFL